MTNPSTYKAAGVDIDAGNTLVEHIKNMAAQTRRNEVISGIGGFSGLFSLGHLKVNNPVLVAATDGVGTKLQIALEMQNFNGLGQDLVAMCVNDLICCGAEPLFFLDYYATGKLQISQAKPLIQSIADSLKDINCTLLGGETAEMPGLYKDNDFDIAGFAVGLVDKDKIIDGSDISIGSKLIGVASSGFHSNGYSLVRKVISDHRLDLNKVYPFSTQTLGEALLAPTVLYVNAVKKLLKQHHILAMAHITGGGLVENVPRILPKQCKVIVQKNKIKVPEIFRFFQDTGQIPEDEMWRVFNMGIGFALVVKPDEEEACLQNLVALNLECYSLGTVENKKEHEAALQMV